MDDPAVMLAETIPASSTMLVKEEEAHPYAFHVSGPRNVASPNWRDLINSSWKDSNYKRTVMACFTQAAYLLELDRQENRNETNALAPNWWIPFRYKLTQTLIDDRDGSIFGAVLEWDRTAALADLVLIRPSGAPRAVCALRGTLLKSTTMRRDIEDDLRFLAWESLKGSVRFKVVMNALKSVAQRNGSSNVCVAGHSLGAGFALQVGKALAKEGLVVEAHLFNPPSISLAMSLKNIGGKVGTALKKLRSMLPSSSEIPISDNANSGEQGAKGNHGITGLRNWVPQFHGEKKSSAGLNKWVPHLYINDSDYICCNYADKVDGYADEDTDMRNLGAATSSGNVQSAAKLFVRSKKKQKFLEAHGLEQWWLDDLELDDLELQSAIHNGRLITQQLKSLYSLPAARLQNQPKER